MPKVSDVKTVLVPKQTVVGHTNVSFWTLWRSRFVLVAAVLVVGLIVLLGLRLSGRTDHLQLNGITYDLTVASTAAAQTQGLGNRTSLAADKGMVFVFKKPAVQCFWMKDMHFSLDMLWLNQQKQVVHMEQNVSPATYPHVYCPTTLSVYVIELNAGMAKTNRLSIGQQLHF